MTVSLVYITDRGAFCMQGEPWCHLSQFAVLSDALRAQKCQSFELVVVDRENQLPRHELDWLGDRVRYLRPRYSPWQALGAFSAATARNTGLLEARGDIVMGIDDCCSFGPRLVELVLDYASRGQFLAPTYSKPGSLHAGAPARQEMCGGIVAYQRKIALELGGWEERFNGSMAFEDWEFSTRLIRNGGVEFIADPEAHVTLYPHSPRQGRIQRCCHAVWKLLSGQPRANRPWSPVELEVFRSPVCPYLEADGCHAQPPSQNRYRGCDTPCRPSAEAVRIMETYESVPQPNEMSAPCALSR